MKVLEIASHCGLTFQVTLEESQDESFSFVSAQKSWEMVLQRVNNEIKERSSQEQNFQPLENIDGLLMFGFRSPAIIQVILTNRVDLGLV